MDFNELRKEYLAAEFRRSDLSHDPYEQFTKWLHNAVDCNVIEPNAMALATASKEGAPSNRIVLMKKLDKEGICFYTNYESRKGRELLENPRATAVFWWKEIERQVIIEGCVEKTSKEDSEAYFSSRPLKSRLAAWTSKQGCVVESREELERQFHEREEQFANGDVPLPEHWGGFRLTPFRFEFWQGRRNRLHDRFQYLLLEDASWKIDRISP